nr:MAG TPA: hypothetical protein [Caudoviricetes sp.]
MLIFDQFRLYEVVDSLSPLTQVKREICNV